MNVLFVTRKKSSDIGGLSRFTQELYSHFPYGKHLLTVTNPLDYFKIPYKKIDLIHLCDGTLFPVGLVIKSIIHKPLTVTVHGLDIAFPHPIYQFMLKSISPKAHAVILVSKPVEKLLKNFPINIKRNVVVNSGISIQHLFKDSRYRFFRSSGRARLLRSLRTSQDRSKRVSSNLIRLVTVGNLVKRKGHVWFIKNVFTKLSHDFVYLIVGDGPERETIQSTIYNEQLTNRVFLLGQISDQELGMTLRKSDIYICPNQQIAHDFEGFGIAAGEAARMGLPVVATKVDGIPEVIHQQKNGLLTDPNPSQMLQYINKLKQPQRRKDLGSRAKIYTREHFDWKETINQYMKVFQEVISNNR